jgi:hypothetical protein
VKPDLSLLLDDEAEGKSCMRLLKCRFVHCLEDLFCLSKCISSKDNPALAAAFEEKARSTHKLVAAFVQLKGPNSFGDDMYRRYQRCQTEVCHLILARRS